MRFTAIGSSAWEKLKKEHRRVGSLYERTFRHEARSFRPVAQQGRVPNTEHQQANAPTI